MLGLICISRLRTGATTVEGEGVGMSKDTENKTESVFVGLLMTHESIPSLVGRYDNPKLLTGPPGYISWQNSFLGIDSCAP